MANVGLKQQRHFLSFSISGILLDSTWKPLVDRSQGHDAGTANLAILHLIICVPVCKALWLLLCFAISLIGIITEAWPWASFINTFLCLDEWIWKPYKFLLISCWYWLGCRGAFERFTEHVPESLAVSAFFSTIRPQQWEAELLHGHIQKLILFDIACSDCLGHLSNHSLVDPS